MAKQSKFITRTKNLREKKGKELLEALKLHREMLINIFEKFIQKHILEDEIDGIERTLVDFNYNEWIRFKKELLEEVQER